MYIIEIYNTVLKTDYYGTFISYNLYSKNVFTNSMINEERINENNPDFIATFYFIDRYIWTVENIPSIYFITVEKRDN